MRKEAAQLSILEAPVLELGVRYTARKVLEELAGFVEDDA